MHYKDFFKDKKVTLMGLGLLGRGIGDAKFLASHCKQLIVTDLKTKEELHDSVAELSDFSNITYRLGEHNLEDFEHVDMVIKSASVPLITPFTSHAEKNNIPIYMSTALFVRFFNGTIIGITGTKGKSTTTEIIYHVLCKSGEKVLLGGNIAGVSTLSLLPEAQDYAVAVLGLDSWQLQGFHTEKLSPNIAVFTNFMEDHMNYYKGDMKAYFYDKSAIYKYQNKNDYFITEESIIAYSKKFKINTSSKVITVNNYTGSIGSLIGNHNRKNAAKAFEVLKAYGLSEEAILKHFKTLSTPPGRLEKRASTDYVDFYNDTNATIPEATINSLRALKEEKYNNILLITGGSYKEIEVNNYFKQISPFVSELFLLEGTGTERALKNLPIVPYGIFSSLQKAFEAATEKSTAKEKTAIILSPAFASFGMFKNEYDRGEQFNRLVQEYINQKN